MKKLFQKFKQHRVVYLRKQIFLAYLEYLKESGTNIKNVTWILDDIDKIIIFINTRKFELLE